MPLPKARDNFSTIWRIAKTITVPNTVDRGPDASIQFILLSEFPGKTKHQAMDKMMLYLHGDRQSMISFYAAAAKSLQLCLTL